MSVGELKYVNISDILYLFGQENFIFIKEKAGDFEKWYLWQPKSTRILRSNKAF